jgi:hypothetical protein
MHYRAGLTPAKSPQVGRSFRRSVTRCKKTYATQQIIAKLRQADVAAANGATVAEICKRLGITDVTCYRWLKPYGGLFYSL